MNLLLDFRIDHDLGSHPVWAGEAWRGAEQATDQRPFRVNLAAILAQVRAAVIGKGRRMRCLALDRKPRHLIGRSGDRPAAVVATGFALK